MASVNTIEAPVYRYFVVDLMSNEVLMEVPFQGVSYERALKNAGEFSGEIPVIEKTRHLGLYENTMPGQTGLYVGRDYLGARLQCQVANPQRQCIRVHVILPSPSHLEDPKLPVWLHDHYF
jgi:hypothetical protein